MRKTTNNLRSGENNLYEDNFSTNLINDAASHKKSKYREFYSVGTEPEIKYFGPSYAFSLGNGKEW